MSFSLYLIHIREYFFILNLFLDFHIQLENVSPANIGEELLIFLYVDDCFFLYLEYFEDPKDSKHNNYFKLTKKSIETVIFGPESRFNLHGKIC